jgi:hypothetical protein
LDWRRLHNKELRNLYASLNMIRVIKSRNMRLAGHVARMREWKCMQNFGRKPEGKRPLGRLRRRGVDGRIILEWSLWKHGGKFHSIFGLG